MDIASYSFAFSTTSNTNTSFSSRERANAPQLVIEYTTWSATPTPGPSPTPTRTPTPVGTNTPTVPPTVTPTSQPVFQNATFIYDGDGKRVKSTINSAITTYFVGAHYELTGSTVTKYYYAGSQRIAMRTGGTLNYLLGDHLGSTSLTTDAAGNKVSEVRYKAWGEVRYASGNVPTKYQYTGQFSYEQEFGLYFYNARWYDSYLNHFTQPDSIVPDPYNSLDWNRYSYARYNPVRYTDPSGHSVDCGIGDPYCAAGKFNFRIPKPSNKCVGDCYDAYLTYEEVAYQLGRPPSMLEVLYMTADTEYTLYAADQGVRSFGQEGLARNYYEFCPSDSGCQGDELYNFLSGYEPWSDRAGIESNKKTPAERAQHLINTLDGNKTWLWDDVKKILNFTYAESQKWTQGMWTGEPWQWYGPFQPSRTCSRNVTAGRSVVVDKEQGYYFWMLTADGTAAFHQYCP